MPKKEVRIKKQELRDPQRKITKPVAKRKLSQSPRHSDLSKNNSKKIVAKTIQPSRNPRTKSKGNNNKTLFNNLTMKTKLLFIFGFLFLFISLGWHLNQTIQLMFFTPKVVAVEKKYAIPTEIKIPKVNVNLPVEQTAINNGVWQIADKGASHLSISARPGEEDTIIMYAHNTLERFGPIRWLSKGDVIEITTQDKKLHKYKITETMTVAPNKMDVLTKKRGEALILYTCDGFADLQRFVLVALPTK